MAFLVVGAPSARIESLRQLMPRRGTFVLAALFWLAAVGAAWAQNPGSAVLDGNAVTSGFSGVQLPAQIAPGVDPVAQASIDLEAPALRIVDLQALGGAAAGQVVQAAKPVTITARQIGQVFAIALDNANPPNIYAAATSAYGLAIVAPDADGDGQPDRAEQGRPGATFMPGLFGPVAAGAGPGSVWRIDGVTGEARVLATIGLDGVANGGAALGGLAFDPASRTLLVADRETGMVHRIDLGGREVGRYDHGVQGRAAAGLAPVPFDAATRGAIVQPGFQAGKPETWGYAPAARRIFAVAVHAGRLYYAVADGLQIWSVASGADGSFGADARMELAVAPGSSPSEISKIVFDDQGRILLAERAAPSGAFDFVALNAAGGGRVLRFAPAPADSGKAWLSEPEDYAVGMEPEMRQGNGGIAIGYGHDARGGLDRTRCGGYLWISGEQLRVTADKALAARLDAGGPADVNGLQGNEIDLVRPRNAPPLQSYFIDFDDRFEAPEARGQMGDVAIWRACATSAGAVGPGAVPGGQQDVAVGPAGEPQQPGDEGAEEEGDEDADDDGVVIIDDGADDGGPPPPPACPPGFQLQPGIQCCQPSTKPAANNPFQCESTCPGGGVPTTPAQIANADQCMRGFTPGGATCVGGTPPVIVGGLPKCAMPAGSSCPQGSVWDNVPPPAPASWMWSNGTCRPTGAALGCMAVGQEVGLDGTCQNICGPGQRPWRIEQCCPVGTPPGPDGQCAGAIAPNPQATQHVPTNLTVAKSTTGTGQCIKVGANLVCIYNVTVENTGSGEFQGVVTLQETVPPGGTLTAPPGWTCAGGPPTYTCTSGNLTIPPNGSVPFQVRIDIGPAATQAAGCTVPNAIAITAPAGGSNQNSDATDDIANAVAWTTGIAIVDPGTGIVTVLCDPANLRTQKVSNGDCTAVAGGYRCEWTVTITNLGPDPYQGPVNLTETFGIAPTSVTFGAPWTCTGGGTTYQCSHPVLTMPNGGTLTLEVSAVIPEGPDCKVANTAALTLPLAGSPGNKFGGDDAATAASRIPSPRCERRAMTPIPPVVELCPPGLVRNRGGVCIRKPEGCPPGYVEAGKDRCCLRKQMTVNGQCCPQGQRPDARRKTCVAVGPPPTTTCQPPLVAFGERCLCADGSKPRKGRCRAVVEPCKPPLVLREGRCLPPLDGDVRCPPGTHRLGKACVPDSAIACLPPLVPRPDGKACMCPDGSKPRDGRCRAVVEPCKPPLVLQYGKCVLPPCPSGTHRLGRTCVPDSKPPVCRKGTHLVGTTCVPDLVIERPCPEGTHRVGKLCIRDAGASAGTLKPCPPGTHRVGRVCAPNLKLLEIKKPEIKRPVIKRPVIKGPVVKRPEVKRPLLKRPPPRVLRRKGAG